MRWLCVAGLLVASPAMGSTGDVLVVATDDAELSQALVRAATQQFNGPVAPAPLDWSGPVRAGTLRLQVQLQGSAWHVQLVGPLASVARDLKVTSPVRLDVAEAIALALPGLVSRLETRTHEVEEENAAREREKRAARAKALAAEKPLPPPVIAPPPPVVTPPVTAPPVTAPPPEPVAPKPVTPPPPQRPIMVAVRPPALGSTAGLSFGASVLSAQHLTAYGGEVSAQVSFHGPWLARFTMGTYGGQFRGDPIWLIPMGVLGGVRFSGGPVHLDLALGGELNVVNMPIETGLVTSFVGQATASVHLTSAWSLGFRFGAAFTTDTGESSPTAEGHDLYIPQAQYRFTLMATWESPE